jgi:outer membrane protein OmpA-like peptidoglycan-associated protein
MNLLVELKENLTDSVVSRAAYYVDENPEKTRIALEGLIHTVVAGLMKRTTTEIGVNQLYNAIQKGKFDGNLVATFPELLRDPEQINRLAESGSNSISHLLPAMKSAIGLAISGYANIKNSAAITLLGLVTPLILGTLNKIVVEKKLDADGLAALLADQRDHLVELTPERLLDRIAEGLNIQQLLAVGVTPAKRSGMADRSPVQERQRFAPEPEEEGNGSLVKWGVGALVVLALAGGAYYIWNNTQSYSSANEESATSTEFVDSVAVTPVDSAKLRPANPVRTDSAVAPTPSSTPGISATTSLTALAAYLANAQTPEGRSFKVPTLDFEAGTDRLKPAGLATVEELATLMKNNPVVQIRLVGYANDAVPPMGNKALSVTRVLNIKNQLIRAGINYIRIDAIGLGTGNKPADSTAVAKPALKQIDIKVVIK